MLKGSCSFWLIFCSRLLHNVLSVDEQLNLLMFWSAAQRDFIVKNDDDSRVKCDSTTYSL